MELLPIPAKWDSIVTPVFHYWWGMDILESHWKRTQPFEKEKPESDEFQEYMFWRRISVIWACSTIEAFVNSEGITWLGEDFYKDNLERLSIVQKIHTLFAFKYNKRLSRKLKRLVHVTKLVGLRNALVHPKTTELSKDRPEKDDPLAELYTMDFKHLRKVVWTVTGLFQDEGVGEESEETTSNPPESGPKPEEKGSEAAAD